MPSLDALHKLIELDRPGNRLKLDLPQSLQNPDKDQLSNGDSSTCPYTLDSIECYYSQRDRLSDLQST